MYAPKKCIIVQNEVIFLSVFIHIFKNSITQFGGHSLFLAVEALFLKLDKQIFVLYTKIVYIYISHVYQNGCYFCPYSFSLQLCSARAFHKQVTGFTRPVNYICEAISCPYYTCLVLYSKHSCIYLRNARIVEKRV